MTAPADLRQQLEAQREIAIRENVSRKGLFQTINQIKKEPNCLKQCIRLSRTQIGKNKNDLCKIVTKNRSNIKIFIRIVTLGLLIPKHIVKSLLASYTLIFQKNYLVGLSTLRTPSKVKAKNWTKTNGVNVGH